MTNGVPLIEHVTTCRNMYLFERGSLKCGGEHYLKEESGQRYRISRLENNRWTVPTT